MNTLEIPAGGIVFKEGDTNNAMYVILSGSVEVFFTRKNTTQRLAVMNKGDFFGEMALFRAMPRTATAKAILDCRLAVIESRQQLERFLVKNPDFSAKMVRILADRLAHTDEILGSKLEE
ncbi:cyclic nucleotide-binding domain-containing protein [Leptospira noguchii]|uniref:Cyclic nucleotide-binding domain protein n=2 Tax=Leptospira noguchii TaxID=28182 RepID=M6YGV3_9LEPT|nr:cyclic nucleotide-binding domain-containing protein [Leptospira noguchii]EMM98330.1 cyclic nucleotide-binding domain protein [Leptospira noguchii str. 2007001578]EMO91056.1 cyclic nucleotide-binding domain protein [Leptospira noguchii str. 2001034031]EMS87475.1 cyclic nucleotide-binding domain protein [Leptospira noguchii str. Hook]EPE86133.1 cyclic nucleotide-binding domain protein [Leptospira noguchii str. 1993005606]UOG62433.1 cyclic nucleotide-binding domain-containing protein [Leptospi